MTIDSGRRLFLLALVLLFVVATASFLYLFDPVATLFPSSFHDREGFEEDIDGTPPYLTVTRVLPYANVPFVLDGIHGPETLPSDSEDRLDALMQWKGLATSTSTTPSLSNRGSVGALLVADVAELAHDLDVVGSTLSTNYEIVAPVLPLGAPETMRRLVLLTPRQSDDEGFPPSLSQLDGAASEWLRVFCPSDLEAALFKIAWRISGHKDDNVSNVSNVLVVVGDRIEAGRAALEAAKKNPKAVVIVPVWECEGGSTAVEVVSSWPAKSIAFVPYDPKETDDARKEGEKTTKTTHSRQKAPHLLHALAPSLTLAPFRASEFVRGKTVSSRTLTVDLICAQSIVVLNGSPERRWPVSDAMANEVAKAMLTGPDAVASAALLSFYEAQGARLFSGTEERVKAATHRRFDAVHRSSIYTIPIVPVLEQFASQESKESFKDDSIEIAPDRSIDDLVVREVGYDAERRSTERSDEDTIATAYSALVGVDERSEAPSLTPRVPTRWGYREVVVSSSTVDGVRLRKGDRVVIGHQDRASENGTYVVVDDSEGRLKMQTPVAFEPVEGTYDTQLMLRSSSDKGGRGTTNLDRWFWRVMWRCDRSSSTFDVIDRNGVRNGDAVAWTPMSGIPCGVVSAIEKKTGSNAYRIAIDLPATSVAEGAAPRPPWFFPSPTSATAVENVDLTPCVKDEDCPFPSAVLRRGGCMTSGYCDLPLGMDRVGYRGYDPETSVVCTRQHSTAKGRMLTLEASTCRPVADAQDLDPDELEFELQTV